MSHGDTLSIALPTKLNLNQRPPSLLAVDKIQKQMWRGVVAACALLCVASAFVPSTPRIATRTSNVPRFVEAPEKPSEKAVAANTADNLKLDNAAAEVLSEGLPWWWELFWGLPFTKRGAEGEELKLGDSMHVFRTNIEQIYGDYESFDGAPLAEGDISGLQDGTLYLGMHAYAERFGPVYKMCFGPKSFMVIGDPTVAKAVLREGANNYDKGVLAEILEDIMGKGLIPADPITWKTRRRAIVPAFHKVGLIHCVRTGIRNRSPHFFLLRRRRF